MAVNISAAIFSAAKAAFFSFRKAKMRKAPIIAGNQKGHNIVQAVSKPQIAVAGKAQPDEKAEHIK